MQLEKDGEFSDAPPFWYFSRSCSASWGVIFAPVMLRAKR